jgi:acyl-CoA hydrolase
VEAPKQGSSRRRPPNTHEEAEIACGDLLAGGDGRSQDGDTLQFGTGTVSAAMSSFHRAPAASWGCTASWCSVIPALVEGVVTGARKTLHPGKVVGASFGPLTKHEFAVVDGDPRYELYCMSHTNDIAVIAAHDNFCTVNNALMVDLTDRSTARRSGRRSTAARAAPARVRRGRPAREGRTLGAVLPSRQPSAANSGARASSRCSRRGAR